MWKRKITWLRIRRILELEQQNTALISANYKLRMELMVTKNQVGALNELLQREKQTNQGSPDLEWRYNVARKPGPDSGTARKGAEDIT
jgi:hypothetical protein